MRNFSAPDVVASIQYIRSINDPTNVLNLPRQEEVVRNEINNLAAKLGQNSWDIRPAVLSNRDPTEVAAELESLVCL